MFKRLNAVSGLRNLMVTLAIGDTSSNRNQHVLKKSVTSKFHNLNIFIIGFIMLSLAGSANAALRLKTGNDEVDLYKKSYALVIGVSDYAAWPDLPGVLDDVKVVKTMLQSHDFQVQTLLNPRRREFDDTIRRFISEYGQDEENRILIYYAGHGHTLKTKWGRNLGYIVPSDTPLPSAGKGAFKNKGISMSEIEIYAKQMESKHALFVFDSCFSGSLFSVTRSIVPDSITEKTTKPVRQFITAGSADQEVPDVSIFRGQFVEGLKGEADLNKDGYITGTEIAQFLQDTVTNYSRRSQTPQYGKIQDPYLDKGDFVFVNPNKIEVHINLPENQNANSLDVELTFWNSIEGKQQVALYHSYMDQYPTGKFTNLAKTYMQDSERKIIESAPVVFKEKDIVIAPRGEIRGRNLGKYTGELGFVLEQAIKKYTSSSGSVNVIVGDDHNFSLRNEPRNKTSASEDTCSDNSGDILISGIVFSSNNKAKPSLRLTQFDCDTEQKQQARFGLRDFDEDGYKYEIAITRAIDQFIGDRVKKAVALQKIREQQKAKAPAKGKKRVLSGW